MRVKNKQFFTEFVLGLLLVTLVLPGAVVGQSNLGEMRDYRAAVSLLREGKIELARTQYRSFLDQYPDSERRSRALFGLAETYYLKDKHDTAVGYYRQALGGELPDNYRSKAFRRGLEAARRSNRLEEARRIVGLAGDSVPGKIPEPGLLDAVMLYETRGKTTEALELVETVLEDRTQAPKWLHEKAVLLAGLGRYEPAKEIIDRLIGRETGYETEARFLRAEVQAQLGNLTEAREDYDRLLDVPEFRPDALYGLAWVHIDDGNYDGAVTRLRQLWDEQIKGDRRLQAMAARDLARVHARLEENSKAGVWYDSAVELSDQPGKSKLLIEKAQFLVDRDRIAEAVPYFERAELGLPVESKKSLIEGYVARREYNKAVEELEASLEAGLFEGHRWRRLMAYCYFRLHDFESALDKAPDPGKATGSVEAVKSYRLLGSIYYRLGKLSKAEKIFEKWKRKHGGAEPDLYLALVRDRSGSFDRAVTNLREILNGEPAPGLEARTRYHLARILFPGELEAVQQQLNVIEAEQLGPALKLELDLLKQAFRLRRDRFDRKTRSFVQSLRARIKQDVYLGRWYGTILQEKVPRRWWTEFVLSELDKSEFLIRKWGARTIRHLRRRGWTDLALRTARKINPDDYTAEPARRLELAYLESLLASDKLKKLEAELADLEPVSGWKGEKVRGLVRVLTSFYRRVNRSAEGFNRLQELRKAFSGLDSSNKYFLKESLAALALESGREKQARKLLEEIPGDQLSKSATLNLAITRYHAGETEAAYRRLTELQEQWDSPPDVFYDYGFRILRARGETRQLKQLSQEFLAARSFRDTGAAEPLVINIRFWANQGAGTTAVEFIDRLEEEFDSSGLLARLEYYRGVSLYNLGRLAQARETFEQVRENYDPDRGLLVDVLRSEVELAVRRDDWPLAYDRWKRLHELGAGGELGPRLVNELGLRQVPEKFEEFIGIMETDYPGHLARGDTYYWHGRVAASRNQDTSAVEYYEQYLEAGAEKRRVEVRRRLARAYERLVLTRKAREQWRVLSEVTDRPRPLVRRAILSRKLGEPDRSTELLRRVRDEFPERQHWFDYQLGRNLVLSGEVEKGLKQIEASLSDAPETVSWGSGARLAGAELALNNRRSSNARRLLAELDTSPRVLLYRAELSRQQEQLGEAVRQLREFKQIAGETDRLSVNFSEVAAKVYSGADSYAELLRVLPETPENPDRGVLRLRALIELGRLEAADNFYQRLSSEAVPRAAEILADAYFDTGEWRYARGYYEEAEKSTRVLYRLTETELELENNSKARRRFERTLEFLGEKEADEWREPLLALAERLADRGESPKEVATLLADNWKLFRPLAGPVGRLGIRLATRADLPDQVQFFMEKIPRENLDVALFVKIAEYFRNRKAWERIGKLLGNADPRADSYPHAYDFYSRLAELRRAEQPPAGLVDELSGLLDRATEDESVYAPRTQELLGDFYFERGEYEKAAVEYHKVRFLVDFPPNLSRSRYKLGLTHLKMDNSGRARNIFEELEADTTVKQDLRQEIRGRLEDL